MIIQRIETAIAHNAVRSLSDNCCRVSQTALDAVRKELELRNDLKQSGYFVRLAENRRMQLLFAKTVFC